MSTVYQQLAQAIQNLTPPPEDSSEIVARLGYTPAGGSYTIRVGSSSSLVWVRPVKGGIHRWPTQACNFGSVPLVPDLPVRCQVVQDRLHILGLHSSAVEFLGTSSMPAAVGQHTHRRGSGNEYRIEARSLEMGLVHAHREAGEFSLRVYIEPLWYVWEGISRHWPGGTLDLSGYVPPTGLQRWVKVGLNPATTTPCAAGGIPAALQGTLSRSSLAAIPCAGWIPLCGVRLRAGQTAINDEWTFEDCSPWRSGGGLDLLTGRKHNLTASAAPGVSDDADDGYSLGSWWFDTLAHKAYVCVSASAGAAIWTQAAGGSGGAVDAAAVTYTPATTTDWGVSGGAWALGDPGNVDGALDQLADRVQTLEDATPSGSGDMLKAVYDTNDDGVVDHALNADALGGVWAANYSQSGHTHDSQYFAQNQFKAASNGAADAGKPVRLNTSGLIDSSMLPAGNAAIHQALFYFAGTLAVGRSPLRIYNATGQAKTISKVFLACDTAPTGAALICDVRKNEVTLFTTPANRPQIPAEAHTGESTSMEVTTWAAGEYLTTQIDQIGSTTPGADLVLHLVYA